MVPPSPGKGIKMLYRGVGLYLCGEFATKNLTMLVSKHILMVIYDFIFEHDKLQLQSPSVLYVKDRSCKECGVV